VVCNWVTGNGNRSIAGSLSISRFGDWNDRSSGFLKLYKVRGVSHRSLSIDNCHECTGSVIYYARYN
jgi:hypothetical protein